MDYVNAKYILTGIVQQIGAATQRQIKKRKCPKTSVLLNVYVQNV